MATYSEIDAALDNLETESTNIYNAILTKGGTVDDAKISQYATGIMSIPTGGGGIEDAPDGYHIYGRSLGGWHAIKNQLEAGVYVYLSDGSFINPTDYAAEEALGVALITPNVQILIGQYDSSATCGSNAGGYANISWPNWPCPKGMEAFTYAQYQYQWPWSDAANGDLATHYRGLKAYEDYKSLTVTSDLIMNMDAWSIMTSQGFLAAHPGSTGQWLEIYYKITEINNALQVIGFDPIQNTDYWTSTTVIINIYSQGPAFLVALNPMTGSKFFGNYSTDSKQIRSIYDLPGIEVIDTQMLGGSLQKLTPCSDTRIPYFANVRKALNDSSVFISDNYATKQYVLESGLNISKIVDIVPQAPADGNIYLRANGAWQVPEITTPSNGVYIYYTDGTFSSSLTQLLIGKDPVGVAVVSSSGSFIIIDGGTFRGRIYPETGRFVFDNYSDYGIIAHPTDYNTDMDGLKNTIAISDWLLYHGNRFDTNSDAACTFARLASFSIPAQAYQYKDLVKMGAQFFIPAGGQLQLMHTNMTLINEGLATIGRQQLTTGTYLTSSFTNPGGGLEAQYNINDDSWYGDRYTGDECLLVLCMSMPVTQSN